MTSQLLRDKINKDRIGEKELRNTIEDQGRRIEKLEKRLGQRNSY